MSERRNKLTIMAEKSAGKYNNPYPILGSNVEGSNIKSIDWDNPDWAVTPNDPRWIFPEKFDLGTHQWYRELPESQQIDIGMKRIANVTRTGLEFEQALLAGIAMRNQLLIGEKHYDEFRYMTHEATEEQHHILMFNEMIRRIGVDTYGSPKWFRNLITPAAGPVGQRMPALFYATVLAGEEPVDYLQRELIEYGDSGQMDIHPMVRRVMGVHVEEEARHISAAEKLMEQYLSKASKTQLSLFAKTYPVIARLGISTTLVPNDETLQYMGVPKWVAKEVWFDSEHGRETLHKLSHRARRRAERLGLRDPKLLGKAGKKIWQACGIEDL
jgi:hypothetical protein